MAFNFFNSSSYGVDGHALVQGDGTSRPLIQSVTPINSNKIRVAFDRDIDFHIVFSIAQNPVTYKIERVSDDARLWVLRVEKVDEQTVDLLTLQHEAVDYRITVSPELNDAWGNAIDPAGDSTTYTGLATSEASPTWMASLFGVEAGMQEEQQVGFLPDLDPPYLDNQNPAPAQPNVPRATDIEFDILDDRSADTGVDIDTVKVWIEGVLAWENDAPQPGFSGVRSAIAGGENFVIDPSAIFPESAIISVRVQAYDLASIPNLLDTTYEFNTAGTEPYLANQDPQPLEFDVDPSGPIQFDILDPETGVDPASIWIRVNGDYAWFAGAPQAGFAVNRISIADGYRFIIQKSGLLPTGSNSVEVYAENQAELPDALHTTYTFTTVDILAPRLVDVDPYAGQTDVVRTTPIVFTIVDDAEVVQASIRIVVNDSLVYNGVTDTFADGWGASIKTGTPSTGFSFSLIREEEWEDGEEVFVGVIASDPTGLTMNEAYSFVIESEVEFPFSSYRFIIRSIREKDEKSPGLIQKFMEMIDRRWKGRIFDRATELATLYDPQRIDAKWLPWLKAHVGFTRDLSFEPSVNELRAVIQDGVQLWNDKPAELSLVDAIRMCTGNRYRIGNFFDFRIQSDWTCIGEQLQDFDPHVLDFDHDIWAGDKVRTSISGSTGYPWDHYFVFAANQIPNFSYERQFSHIVIDSFVGYPDLVGIWEIEKCLVGDDVLITKEALPVRSGYNYGRFRLLGGMSEFRTEVRVVDDPTGDRPINRDLLVFLMSQVRAMSERVDIVFVDFLDQFINAGDTDQWSATGIVNNPGGRVDIYDGGQILCSEPNRLDWFDQSTVFNVTGEDASTVAKLFFWYNDADNCYWVELDFGAETVKLFKRSLGATTQVGSTVTLPYIVYPGIPCGVRIDGQTEGVGRRVRVKIGGNTEIDEYSGPPTVVRGGPGVSSSGGTTSCRIVEVMTTPATWRRVGPNP